MFVHSLYLLLLVCVLSAVVAKNDKTLRIKLQQRKDNGKHMNAIHRLLTKNSHSVNETLIDQFNYYYEGYIHLGTPPRSFIVDFDTGSPIFWLAAINCTDIRGNKCVEPHLYDYQNSSTATSTGKRFKIQYGSGATKGFYVTDTLGLTADPSVANVKNVTFGAADLLIGWMSGTDGLFGLSFGDNIKNKNPAFIDILNRDHVFENPIFTIWLDSSNDNSSEKLGGEIEFGGTDNSRCGEVISTTKAQVIPGPWWTFNIQTISVNGKAVGNAIAITDTGTTAIYANYKIFSAIIEKAPILALPEFSCDTKIPDLKLDMLVEGKNLTLTTEDFVLRLEDECAPSIYLGQPGDPFDILLGDVFIRRYCQIHNYDQKTVGFALAKHDS
ncbi:Peptidase A1 domain-containing protein [Aphelenchoides besseyi]|nr:Peptidase A1 domain-containing protein [Aphelenchoides besseyi]KAI6198536.1 Peptidase A1 domain-containing protein [Aphelenchoides besseyi]